MTTSARIEVAMDQPRNALHFRCSGSCTLSVCPALQDAIAQHDGEPLAHLYFDLSSSDAIDSTFAGFLLSLHRREKQSGSPHLHLVAPSPGVRRTFEIMNVARLLDINDAAPPVDAETWQPVELSAPHAPPTDDFVIECHENLIDADARNREPFTPVVEGLRRAQDNPRRKPPAS